MVIYRCSQTAESPQHESAPREPLLVTRQLLTQDPAERSLQGFAFSANVLSECGVDQGLLASSASGVNLLSKPPQEIVVDADRY